MLSDENNVINISKINNATVAGKLIRLPLKLIPAKSIVPILQGELKGYKWIKGSSINGCWLGSYEFEKQVLFGNVIKRGMVVYDIGANVGFYTLLASKLAGDTGRVYSFEPFPGNIEYLKKQSVISIPLMSLSIKT